MMVRTIAATRQYIVALLTELEENAQAQLPDDTKAVQLGDLSPDELLEYATLVLREDDFWAQLPAKYTDGSGEEKHSADEREWLSELVDELL